MDRGHFHEKKKVIRQSQDPCVHAWEANEIFKSTSALPIPIAKSMSSLERTKLDDGESGDMWNAGMSHTHPRATCK